MNDPKIIEWLRSPSGARWSRNTHVSATRHQHSVFAEEKWDLEHCVEVAGLTAICPCNSRVPHYADFNTMQIAGEIAAGTVFEDDEDYTICDTGSEWLRKTYKNPDMLSGFGPNRRLHP